MSEKQPPPYNPQTQGGYPPPPQGYQQGYPGQQPGYPNQQPPPGYPSQQPPPGYPPQQPAQAYPYQQTTTANVAVVHQQPAVTAVKFGESPVSNYQCPYCNNVVTTRTRNKTGNTTLIVMLIAFLFIGFFALIFLCIPIFDDVEHVCPVDGNVVGVYKRF